MRPHPSQWLALGSMTALVAGVMLAGHYCKPNTAWASAPVLPVLDEMAPVASAPPPLKLTASDGTGLALVSMVGRAVVSDPLAFTELRLTFRNPNDRIIEGNFSITLPPGATVSRFAMKLATGWQEGEMVEKRAARVAYEDFLHRKQDPALLEQGPGNEFSARVFPIPANGTKEIIVSYSQELKRAWSLPLRGLPTIGSLDLAVSMAGDPTPRKTLVAKGYEPMEDFGLEGLRATPGLRSGNLVLARVHAMPEEAPDPIGASAILVDTSASRALGFEAEVELVGAIAHDIATRAGVDTPLAVVAFDQSTETIFDGKAGGFDHVATEKLEGRSALGASNLEGALAWAKQRGVKRVVLVTDGVPTSGETDPEKLAAIAKGLAQGGVERIDAVTVGGIRDDSLLRRVVTSGLPRDGVVVDGRFTIASIARRLNGATRFRIPVAIAGARWSYPTTLDGVQAGDEALVYADVPESTKNVVVTVDGKTSTYDLQNIDRPLLERAWVQAKIRSSHDEHEIVALSKRFRVMSPYTSLLVLETEQDYARFGIERNALADILAVDARGQLTLSHRQDFATVEAKEATRNKGEEGSMGNPTATATATATPASRERALQEAAEFGMIGMLDRASDVAPWGQGLGLSGTGQGGGGRGEGIGFGSGSGRLGGAHQTAAPSIRQGTVTVSGGLPPEVVQRIVRQNFGRHRLCYSDALRTNPALRGHVTTRFTIAKDGSVSDVSDAGSNLPNDVGACVRRVFMNLSFPEPRNGAVSVTYPLTFDGPDSSDAPWGVSQREEVKPPAADPYTGKLKDVMSALARNASGEALATALAWNKESPGDVMALVALGEAYEAAKNTSQAARAYGSIIDLFAGRADLRRFAGERLERIQDDAARDLALDTFEKARVERPDHPASHRLLAFALLRRRQYERAFEVAAAGAKQTYPAGRFLGVDQILREDLGLVAAAWTKAEPARRDEIAAKLVAANGAVENAPSIRFVLNWETDANDVDFHIYDDEGGHAWYASKHLPSGGDLYADVTTGYGPECFTIRKPKAERASKYTLQANYYSRGPMGYGMGKLEIIDHDGHGNLTFEERPFVVMVDHAFVDMGVVTRK